MKELTQAQRIIEGIQLVEKHRPSSESEYHTRAEHDEFIIGSLEWGVPVDQMEDLGWSANEDYNGFVYTL